MSTKKKVIWLIVILMAAIQFIRPARNIRSGQAPPTDIQNVVAIPPHVQSVLKTACYDCHSNNTVYPWYANVQPVGLFLQHHINEGKEELNFNEFGSYSLRKQKHKLESIESNVKEGSMPLSSYTMIHINARLSESDKAAVMQWARDAQNNLNTKK